MSKVFDLTLACGARLELIPVFVDRFKSAPKFAGYRLNLIHAPGAGVVSPVELEQIAELFTEVARGGPRG